MRVIIILAVYKLSTLCYIGVIRSIGVSNFEVQDLRRLLEIASIHPSVVQNPFDVFSQDLETRQFCDKNNIRYTGHRYTKPFYLYKEVIRIIALKLYLLLFKVDLREITAIS